MLRYRLIRHLDHLRFLACKFENRLQIAVYAFSQHATPRLLLCATWNNFTNFSHSCSRAEARFINFKSPSSQLPKSTRHEFRKALHFEIRKTPILGMLAHTFPSFPIPTHITSRVSRRHRPEYPPNRPISAFLECKFENCLHRPVCCFNQSTTPLATPQNASNNLHNFLHTAIHAEAQITATGYCTLSDSSKRQFPLHFGSNN